MGYVQMEQLSRGRAYTRLLGQDRIYRVSKQNDDVSREDVTAEIRAVHPPPGRAYSVKKVRIG